MKVIETNGIMSFRRRSISKEVIDLHLNSRAEDKGKKFRQNIPKHDFQFIWEDNRKPKKRKHNKSVRIFLN